MRLRVLAALCGLLPVGALLAWAFGLGSFRSWFLVVGVPPVLLLAVLWRLGDERFRLAYTAGVVGGLAGAIGYDLFRVPFALYGLRIFSPIESYGVLVLGADTSSPLTDLVGWSFHFVNGIGFGVAYAMFGLGRSRWWAVAWAMVLETATIVTPFATLYGLAGKWHLIGIAYAAHAAYGLPLGMVCESAPKARRAPLRMSHAGIVVAILVVGLLAWHRPFSSMPDPGPGYDARIVDGRFQPEWIRVREGGCAVVRDGDQRREFCFDDPGVHRVRLTGEPYSGGFVIVERG